MDNATRLQYLEAMGIAVWIPRHQPVAVQPSQVADSGQDFIESAGWADDCMEAADSPPRAQEAMPERKTAPASAAFGMSCDSAVAEHDEAHHDASSANQPNHSRVEQSVTHADNDVTSKPWPSLHETQVTASPHSGDRAWVDLQHEVATCRACGLCETRTQTVFGVGNKHASWMLIGEAPGQNEDLQGEPFVGRAGQLLTEMLRAIGLRREEVYIANILKCRPPNNRDPQGDEVAACHDFLRRQIALLRPKIILAVGRIAAQNLLKTQQPLAKLRGVRHQLDNIPLIVIPHPAYLLRSLPEKAKAWEDLQFALSVYKELE